MKMNHMRYILSTILLLYFFSLRVGAQSVSNFEFSEMRTPSKFYTISYLPLESGQSIVVKGKKSVSKALKKGFNTKISLELCDEHLNSKKQIETDFYLKYSLGSTRYKFHSIKQINGKIYVFYLLRSESKFMSVYAVELDEQSFELSANPKQIAIFKNKSKKGEGKVTAHFSPNNERIVFSYNEIVFREIDKKTDHRQLIMLNDNFEKVWQSSLYKPLPGIESQYLDVLLNEVGEVFILERLREPGSYLTFLMPGPVLGYAVNKFDRSGELIPSKEIYFENKRVKDLKISFNKNGELQLLGYCFDNVQVSDQVGSIIYQRHNSRNLRRISKAYIPFDLDFYLQGKEEKVKSRIKKNLEKNKSVRMGFDIHYIEHRQDGGLTILGEEHYFKSLGSVSDPQYIHYFNDIVVVQLDAAGEVLWKRKIPKRQEFKYTSSSLKESLGHFYIASYTYAMQDDDIYLFFNDSPDNGTSIDKDVSIEKTPYKELEANFCSVQIKPDGAIKKKVLFNARDHGVNFFPSLSRFWNSEHSDLFLFGLYKKNVRFGRYRSNPKI